MGGTTETRMQPIHARAPSPDKIHIQALITACIVVAKKKNKLCQQIHAIFTEHSRKEKMMRKSKKKLLLCTSVFWERRKKCEYLESVEKTYQIYPNMLFSLQK
jgi:hypothetical protein